MFVHRQGFREFRAFSKVHGDECREASMLYRYIRDALATPEPLNPKPYTQGPEVRKIKLSLL